MFARTNAGAGGAAPQPRARDYTVPSVAAAARILTWLGGRSGTLSVISAALGLSKSSAYAVLKTLANAALVSYDEGTKQYRLGVALMALGEAAGNQLDHVQVVKPLLRELVSQTGLTGLVARPTGNSLVVIHKEEGTADVRATTNVGQVFPANAGAIGKAYAAFTEASRAKRLAASTPRTITDPARWRAELEATRRRGYATSLEEYRLGVNAVAAPVLDHSGRVVLLLSLIGFATTLNGRSLERLGARLRDACARASRELGSRGDAA